MTAYLVRRALGGSVVILALVVFVFFASHYIGDPINLLVDKEFTTPAETEALRRAGGFDRPVWEQFGDFMKDAARGDFGVSIWQNRAASAVVFERIPSTVYLMLATLALTFAVSIPLGLVAARGGRAWWATLITVVTTALGSVPPVWLSLGMVFLFAVQWQLLPTSGYGSWQHIILPALALAAVPIGRFTQVIETSVADELSRPYVSTARSKGLSERTVMSRHVARNAAIIGVTLLGGEIISLFNGAVLVESIFAWPGIGQIALTAVQKRDLPVLMSAVVFIGVIVTVTNLLVDLSYAAIDPRVRLR